MDGRGDRAADGVTGGSAGRAGTLSLQHTKPIYFILSRHLKISAVKFVV